MQQQANQLHPRYIYGTDPGSVKNFIGGGVPAHLGAQLKDRKTTWESVRYWEMRDSFIIDLNAVAPISEIVMFNGNPQRNNTTTNVGQVLTNMQTQGEVAATQAFVAVSWALYLAPVINDAIAGQAAREVDYLDEQFLRNQTFTEMVANQDNKLLSINTHRLLFPGGATQALTVTDAVAPSEGQVDPRVGHQFWLRNDAWIFPPLTTFTIRTRFDGARTWLGALDGTAQDPNLRVLTAVMMGWRMDNVQMALAA